MAQTEVMPAVEQQRIGKPGDPCIMVIFGATGDLTRRKLIPALYNLAKNDLLSREFAMVGVAAFATVRRGFPQAKSRKTSSSSPPTRSTPTSGNGSSAAFTT